MQIETSEWNVLKNRFYIYVHWNYFQVSICNRFKIIPIVLAFFCVWIGFACVVWWGFLTKLVCFVIKKCLNVKKLCLCAVVIVMHEPNNYCFTRILFHFAEKNLLFKLRIIIIIYQFFYVKRGIFTCISDNFVNHHSDCRRCFVQSQLLQPFQMMADLAAL